MQRELYPRLVLFPPEREKAVPYDGDITVADVIKFLVAHGSHLLDLVKDKGKYPRLIIFTILCA